MNIALHGAFLCGSAQHIFQEEAKKEWFKAMGKRLIGDLLLKADKVSIKKILFLYSLLAF